MDDQLDLSRAADPRHMEWFAEGDILLPSRMEHVNSTKGTIKILKHQVSE